jgi:hypothetical protein
VRLQPPLGAGVFHHVASAGGPQVFFGLFEQGSGPPRILAAFVQCLRQVQSAASDFVQWTSGAREDGEGSLQGSGCSFGLAGLEFGVTERDEHAGEIGMLWPEAGFESLEGGGGSRARSLRAASCELQLGPPDLDLAEGGMICTQGGA